MMNFLVTLFLFRGAIDRSSNPISMEHGQVIEDRRKRIAFMHTVSTIMVNIHMLIRKCAVTTNIYTAVFNAYL